MDAIPAKVTNITKGGDATLVELTIANAKPLIWRVPNMTFDRLGYVLGSDVSVTIDAHGNLQRVQAPASPSAMRPIKM